MDKGPLILLLAGAVAAGVYLNNKRDPLDGGDVDNSNGGGTEGSGGSDSNNNGEMSVEDKQTLADIQATSDLISFKRSQVVDLSSFEEGSEAYYDAFSNNVKLAGEISDLVIVLNQFVEKL